MKTHTFTLILSDVAELNPELADALYAAVQGGIELDLRDGVAVVEVERHAPTLRDAIKTAIREVKAAGVGARVVRVESEAADNIDEINVELLGIPCPNCAALIPRVAEVLCDYESVQFFSCKFCSELFAFVGDAERPAVGFAEDTCGGWRAFRTFGPEDEVETALAAVSQVGRSPIW